jgi:hypothetical protein
MGVLYINEYNRVLKLYFIFQRQTEMGTRTESNSDTKCQ